MFQPEHYAHPTPATNILPQSFFPTVPAIVVETNLRL
jgi:hypothetical protein